MNPLLGRNWYVDEYIFEQTPYGVMPTGSVVTGTRNVGLIPVKADPTPAIKGNGVGLQADNQRYTGLVLAGEAEDAAFRKEISNAAMGAAAGAVVAWGFATLLGLRDLGRVAISAVGAAAGARIST